MSVIANVLFINHCGILCHIHFLIYKWFKCVCALKHLLLVNMWCVYVAEVITAGFTLRLEHIYDVDTQNND